MVKPYQRIVSLVCIACETCECERCNVEDLAKRIIDEELQNFAQWLWDSNYLVNEALTIRLVEQYKYEQLKEDK